MLATLFSTERKPSAKISNPSTLNNLDEKLKKQNEKLKKQIDMLYQTLVDKEATVFKLKKFICDELKKPEYAQKYYSLEDQLNKIFHEDDEYDPRPDWTANNDDASLTERIENGDASLVKDFSQKLERASSEAFKTKKTIDTEKDVSDNSPTLNGIENIDLFSNSDKNEDIPSPCILSRTSIEYKARSTSSISQKNKEAKRVHVNPVEQHVATRRLFNFELELKEYSPPTFEAVKKLIARKNLTADEIHDEIEELAENTAKHKYFKRIFPADTTEKVADELENYVFEILYSRLFVLDDDIRGHNHQFQDRLNVMKPLVTPEMLEIPFEMRKEGLFNQAINELKKINQFKAPGWKMQCIQNCVNYILNAFSDTMQRSPSSDELFPVLVYVVLHANVDLLKYNIDYIHTYLRKCHLMGQIGFLIINFKAVVHFLHGVNGTSLSQGKLEMKKQ